MMHMYSVCTIKSRLGGGEIVKTMILNVVQYAYSVDGQTLQKNVPHVERLSLPPGGLPAL